MGEIEETVTLSYRGVTVKLTDELVDEFVKDRRRILETFKKAVDVGYRPEWILKALRGSVPITPLQKPAVMRVDENITDKTYGVSIVVATTKSGVYEIGFLVLDKEIVDTVKSLPVCPYTYRGTSFPLSPSDLNELLKLNDRELEQLGKILKKYREIFSNISSKTISSIHEKIREAIKSRDFSEVAKMVDRKAREVRARKARLDREEQAYDEFHKDCRSKNYHETPTGYIFYIGYRLIFVAKDGTVYASPSFPKYSEKRRWIYSLKNGRIPRALKEVSFSALDETEREGILKILKSIDMGLAVKVKINS
jgi:hypothetical protein